MPEPNKEQSIEPLNPDRLTWAVLLARWTEFARASVALPEDGEAGRVRQSVTDIITLQAVWFALGQIEELDPIEHGLGLDRAGVLIDRHTASINKRFAGHALPEGLVELIEDVRAAYTAHKA